METKIPEDELVSRKPVNKVYLVITIIIAAVLLYFVARKVSWKETLTTLQAAKPMFLVLVFAMTSLSVFVRGLRWAVLLSAKKKISPLTMFWATSIGYLGNTFLPARAGEVIRSVLLGKSAGISKSYVFATALMERILDVIILILIGTFSLSYIPQIPEWLSNAMRVMALAAIAALAVLLLAPKFKSLYEHFLNWLPLPEKIKRQLIIFFEEFLLGAGSFMNWGRAGKFLLFSAIIWFLDASGAIMMSYALHLQFTYPQAFVLMLAMGLSSAIPSTPGYVGVYQFVAVSLLPLYGVSQSEALAFILAYQGVSIIDFLLWGLIGFWQLNRSPKPIQDNIKPLV